MRALDDVAAEVKLLTKIYQSNGCLHCRYKQNKRYENILIKEKGEKTMYLSETHEKKWQPVLEHPDLPKIKDSYRRAVTSVILENQERAAKEDNAFLSEELHQQTATGSACSNWDPILISLSKKSNA